MMTTSAPKAERSTRPTFFLWQGLKHTCPLPLGGQGSSQWVTPTIQACALGEPRVQNLLILYNLLLQPAYWCPRKYGVGLWQAVTKLTILGKEGVYFWAQDQSENQQTPYFYSQAKPSSYPWYLCNQPHLSKTSFTYLITIFNQTIISRTVFFDDILHLRGRQFLFHNPWLVLHTPLLIIFPSNLPGIFLDLSLKYSQNLTTVLVQQNHPSPRPCHT